MPFGTPISARVEAGTPVTFAIAAADPKRGLDVDGLLVTKRMTMIPTTATTAAIGIHGNHRDDPLRRGELRAAAGRLVDRAP